MLLRYVNIALVSDRGISQSRKVLGLPQLKKAPTFIHPKFSSDSLSFFGIK